MNIILNILFLSIPEEIFIVGFFLLIFGKTEFLEFNKNNIFKISIPVLSTVAVSNLLRYAIGVDVNSILLYSFLTTFVSSILTYKLYTKKLDMFLSLLFVITSYLVLIVLQLYIIFSIRAISVSVEQLNQDTRLMVLITIPERITEFFIVYLLARKRNDRINNGHKFNMIEQLTKNPKQRFIVMFSSIFTSLYLVWFGYVVCYNRALLVLDLFSQVISLSVLICIPIAIIGCNWYYVYIMSTMCFLDDIKKHREENKQ